MSGKHGKDIEIDLDEDVTAAGDDVIVNEDGPVAIDQGRGWRDRRGRRSARQAAQTRDQER
jgi:hypothetical protein